MSKTSIMKSRKSKFISFCINRTSVILKSLLLLKWTNLLVMKIHFCRPHLWWLFDNVFRKWAKPRSCTKWRKISTKPLRVIFDWKIGQRSVLCFRKWRPAKFTRSLRRWLLFLISVCIKYPASVAEKSTARNQGPWSKWQDTSSSAYPVHFPLSFCPYLSGSACLSIIWPSPDPFPKTHYCLSQDLRARMSSESEFEK